MINVFADQHIYHIKEIIPNGADITFFDSNQSPAPAIPDGTQALLLRTVTKINSQTYQQLPDSLSFIATASAGTDHINEAYLADHDITFANAKGCNARSVGEYVAVALLLWAEQEEKNLKNHSVGIIGAGHTGSAVKKLLTKIGVETVSYDPPRAERETEFTSAELKDVLACDILTFHVPLIHAGVYPTHYWLDEQKLSNNSYSLIINASRGGVIDERALIEAKESGNVENYILDVWENEPNFRDEVARCAYLKTPHIAGYSVQAKERATQMIVQSMIDHFKLDSQIGEITRQPTNRSVPSTFWSLTDAITHYHPIEDYKTRLMMLIGRSEEEKVAGFNEIRTGHPLRDELHCFSVPKEVREKFPALASLMD